jgi:hypothetical protein
MKGQQKFEMTVMEDGYEDPVMKRFEEEKKKLKEEQNAEPSFNISKYSLMKKFIIFCLWVLGYKLFIKWEFGMVYLFASILIFIFTNLGERKPWQLSAYSVFNPNFERLPGTMTVGDLQSSMGMGGRRYDNDDDEIYENNGVTAVANPGRTFSSNNTPTTTYTTKAEVKKKQMKEKATQPLNSVCNCGSNKKYKNCCMKKDD